MVEVNIDLQKEYESLQSELEMLGLSTYEVKTYLALVVYGYGDADTIAKMAKIPRTSSYKVLASLEEKGFVVSTDGRPRVYRPVSPESLKRRFVDQIEETFDKISLLKEIVREHGIPQIVYTITGKDRVIEKIAEMLDTAERTFLISTPAISEIRDRLTKNFNSALSRGVEITVITEPFQRAPPSTSVFHKKGLIATDIIADGEKALLAAHDLSACGYTNNPDMAKHLENFINMMIQE